MGVDIAAALGAVGGDSKLGLEVLNDITPQDEEEAKRMLADGDVKLKSSGILKG